MRKVSSLFFLACFTLCSSSCWAVTLGSPQLLSSLGQPLKVHVALKDTEQLSADVLQVVLADAKTFEAQGLQRLPAFDALQLKVLTEKNTEQPTLFLEMTTTESWREPLIQFVVKAQWPNGQLTHQFTLFLDPPLNKAGGIYGPTQTADNLWSIASHLHGAEATVRQEMAALFLNNPKAFSKKNPNYLRQGVSLKIPADDEVLAISEKKASVILMSKPTVLAASKISPIEFNDSTPLPFEGIAFQKSQAAVSMKRAKPDKKLSLEINHLKKVLKQLQQIKKNEQLNTLVQSNFQKAQTASFQPLGHVASFGSVTGLLGQASGTSINQQHWVWGSSLFLFLLSSVFLGGFFAWRHRWKKMGVSESAAIEPESISKTTESFSEQYLEESLVDGYQEATSLASTQEPIDALESAMVYLAAEDYSQAETLLLRAIVRTPERRALKLALLDVYQASGDQENFQMWCRQLAEELAPIDPELSQRLHERAQR